MTKQGASTKNFGPGKLPGLTLFFLINLWIGVGLAVFSGLGILYFLVVDDSILYYFDVPLRVFFLFVCCVLGGWYAWVALSIQDRSPEAPGRCRVLMVISMVLGGLGLVGMLFLLFREFDSYYLLEGINEIMPTVQNLLATIVLSEAWRRYFAVSPKVRATFGPHRPYEGYARAVLGEIGLFQLTCWLCIIYYGLPGVVMLAIFGITTEVQFSPTAVLNFILTGVGGIIIPAIALWAVSRFRHKAILACLGVWLGGELLLYLVNLYEVVSSNLDGYTYGYNVHRMPFLTVALAVPLAFWWYFYTSEKAAAWFNPPQATVSVPETSK